MSETRQFTDGTGQLRTVGLAPTPPHLVGAFPRYEDAAGLVDPQDYSAFDVTCPDYEVKDQGRHNSCDGHAAASSLEFARYVTGQPHVALSAWYPWSILTGGRDVGASISQTLDLVKQRGIAPESLVTYGPHNPRSFAGPIDAAAQRYRIESGAVLAAAAEVLSAVMRRQPLNLAVSVTAGFQASRLDAEGVPPLGGECDHAVTAWGGAKWSDRWNDWLILIWNSWGKRWGHDGTFWAPVKRLVATRGFDCYMVTAAIDDPQGANPPEPLS